MVGPFPLSLILPNKSCESRRPLTPYSYPSICKQRKTRARSKRKRRTQPRGLAVTLVIIVSTPPQPPPLRIQTQISRPWLKRGRFIYFTTSQTIKTKRQEKKYNNNNKRIFDELEIEKRRIVLSRRSVSFLTTREGCVTKKNNDNNSNHTCYSFLFFW